MRFQEWILYRMSKRWKSPVAGRKLQLGTDLESEDYHLNYGIKNQYHKKVFDGISTDILNKKILEIGCGHGGISLFLGMNGAKSVVGIDLNTKNLEHAKKLKQKFESDYSLSLIHI